MINAQELSSEKVFDSTDELSVNTLRMLSVDMIQKAKSGHPGICLDAAPMAYVSLELSYEC